MEERKAKVVLGMGGYVTIPAGLAARKSGSLDAGRAERRAGLANRVASRWALAHSPRFRPPGA